MDFPARSALRWFLLRARGEAGGGNGSRGRQQSRQATWDKSPPAATSFSMFVFVAVAVDKQTKDPPHRHAQRRVARRYNIFILNFLFLFDDA